MSPRNTSSSVHPINKILLSFVALILSGALLLKIPFATTEGISFVDALFTSTSAVCVTGLTVLDTAGRFTFFGQAVILLLIQFGGLGIMTFSIALLSALSGSISIKWRFTFESFYSDIHRLPIKRLLSRVVLYTFVIETFSAAALFSQFVPTQSVPEAAWNAVFHSVSAFCNAGFSTYTENLVGYNENPIVLLVIAANIITGGLGFLVLSELSRTRFRRRKFLSQYSLHTRLVIALTAFFIALGTAGFAALEWNNALLDFSPIGKIINSFFQSVTCRTAGFNTVDIASLRETTLFMMIFLMFTGGSPGSIAGGVKTTTMAVVWLLLVMKFRGRGRIVLWGRALDPDTVEKSTSLFIMALIFVSTSTFMLLLVGTPAVKNIFLSALFEVTSAFGTVGLSTGLTPALSDTGKLLLCAVMYTGRLGPLTLISALTTGKKQLDIGYPEEHIMIG
ncbi:MAG TPA: TrkH family potassium uptake protein [Spirochaetota bacterium]|nr:TrkH family potassium uptake protein [Spirochaetota bacterium]OPZ35520.1 MAG: Ktr system potassium uptake protein B [Spirochaetes bacterium ADurb.BinA120]HPI15928.1 TrkH family potassium uptake protein [Spirochaetota bacterium]HPO46938.1 TrkH family potassium uptake protein [Spirochaetota bacterium]